jgi:hypothetical protein
MRTALLLVATVALAGCERRLTCTQADDEARALIARHAACAEGDRCRVVPLFDAFSASPWQQACVSAFLCSVALREDADESAFLARAREIVDRRDCLSCAVAKCRLPADLDAFCDAATHTCQLRSR